MFQKLLLLNPNDNQGVRTLAEEALFKLDRLEDALKIAEQYPDDIMPDTLYGRALALFKLGRREEATVALQQAVENLPLVGKELLKVRHHLLTTAKPDRVTVGGADEAYYYWEQWGCFWEEDTQALEWLKGIIRQSAKVHRGVDR